MRVRRVAAKILGDIGDSQAIKPLINMLGDADLNVRMDAAKALGRIKDDNAVNQALRDAQRHENKDIRQTAAVMLDKINMMR
ncbi:MAG: HEAT repeat domain-containing protein [Eubacteriales bacterium]|nr:HEAT repeat domain-containing protein [Eubacteriales bacterium]